MNKLYVVAYPACLLIMAFALSALAGVETGEVEDIIDDERYGMVVLPGYGNSGVLHIKGRMYTIGKGYGEFMKEAPFPRIKRPISSLAGFFPDGAKEKPVTIRAGVAGKAARTDGRGYFSASLTAPPEGRWKGTTGVELIARDGRLFRGTVYVPSPDAELGVISDIDDTVKITGVHDHGKVVKAVLFGDAETDKPVPGMAALYADIARSGNKGPRPFHYVSASPYAFSTRIVKFLSLNHFPSGSLDLMKLDLSKDVMSGVAARIVKFLPLNHFPSGALDLMKLDLSKDVTSGVAARIVQYKESAIENIFAAFPGRKFLLFADNGQEDPKIYSRLLSSHPDRIEAIYIREVEEGRAGHTEYPGSLFFTSPDEVRADLVKRGIIRRD
ncbi:MAG: DUF2183 domain-containing protein [Candidatus Tritonobacter lacicola]|nr:DUF2183 domain-containing protein [Candidatus Tritonobacter lacicola]